MISEPPLQVAGTARSNLVRPCEAPGARPATPPPAEPGPGFALALSGGGFRASLAAAGVLRFLADAGLLSRVRHASSVSGSSITNGLFACAYLDLEQDGFTPEAVDELLVRRLAVKVSESSFARKLLRGLPRLPGTPTRLSLLAEGLDEWFFGGVALEELPPTVRWIFGSANAATGVRFGFERDVLGDYVIGLASTSGTRFPLADAVACSAAVPGAFNARRLEGWSFPCGEGADVRLLDGGIYDNLGLEPLDELRDECLVVLSAGGVLRTGRFGWVPVIRDLVRSEALLYRQVTALRTRTMIERFEAWEAARAAEEAAPSWGRRGILFGLASEVEPSPKWPAERPPDRDPMELALTGTSFDRYPPELCERLVHQGWWLTGATLSRYHPELLPGDLPPWRPLW